MKNFNIYILIILIILCLIYLLINNSNEGFGMLGDVKAKLKEEARNRALEYIQSKANKNPKIKPIVNIIIQNKDWLPSLARQLRDNPQIMKVFGFLAAKGQLGNDLTPIIESQIQAQLGSSPKIKEAILILKTDPLIKEKIAILFKFPVIKEVEDELATNNDPVSKGLNLLNIFKKYYQIN